LVLPRPVRPATSATPVGDPTTAVDESALRKLRSFLAAGAVEHADILTTAVMLAAAGRLDSGWLRRDDGQRLPLPLLTEIDQAWATSPVAHQGFSAQLARQPVASGRTMSKEE